MKFKIQREVFLQPLSQVVGVVERRQTLPVLANFLLVARQGKLSVTGTDMEVELVSSVETEIAQEGEITVPARKLLDIVRAMTDGALIQFTVKEDKAILSAGRSRFTLATLPASEFPATEAVEINEEVTIDEGDFKGLLDKTSFAMANQDVRYYLNGLLLEFKNGVLRAVATDGHRLALCDLGSPVKLRSDRQLIVPRKGVLELARLLVSSSAPITLALGRNHVRVVKDGTTFTSKLLDGRFPDYEAVIPAGADKRIELDRGSFAQALQRVAILSNEKYRGVRLEASGDSLKVSANNPQSDEAQDEIEAKLNFESLAVGFNVTYLQDALNALQAETIVLELRDANSSCLVAEPGSNLNRHVVMPLKL